jgi:hypothetical protein
LRNVFIGHAIAGLFHPASHPSDVKFRMDAVPPRADPSFTPTFRQRTAWVGQTRSVSSVVRLQCKLVRGISVQY